MQTADLVTRGRPRYGFTLSSVSGTVEEIRIRGASSSSNWLLKRNDVS